MDGELARLGHRIGASTVDTGSTGSKYWEQIGSRFARSTDLKGIERLATSPV
jgi:hypothetical protein